MGYGAIFPYFNYLGGYTVVSNIQSYNNNKKLVDLNYKYENAVIHKQGLGFCGFENIKNTDNINQVNSSTQIYNPYNYSTLREESSLSKSNVYEYLVKVSPNKIKQILLEKKTSTDKPNDISVNSSYLYDSYCNPIKETTDYGNGITSVTTNKFDYIDNASHYVLGLPKEQSVINTRGGSSITTKTNINYNTDYISTSKISYYNNNKVSEEAYSYDDKWNLIESKSRSYSSPNWLTETYAYDDYGRVIRKTDPLNLYEDYSYDNKGFFSYYSKLQRAYYQSYIRFLGKKGFDDLCRWYN